MALSLGVSAGKRIKVGDAILTVIQVKTPVNVVVELEGERIEVTELERIEVMPQVFLQCGRPPEGSSKNYARIAFEAPRRVRIARL